MVNICNSLSNKYIRKYFFSKVLYIYFCYIWFVVNFFHIPLIFIEFTSKCKFFDRHTTSIIRSRRLINWPSSMSPFHVKRVIASTPNVINQLTACHFLYNTLRLLLSVQFRASAMLLYCLWPDSSGSQVIHKLDVAAVRMNVYKPHDVYIFVYTLGLK